MKSESLKKVLENLVGLKKTMHDVADTSAVEKLDEAIRLVEQSIENGGADASTKANILMAIGKALERLPSIVALLKMFSD